MDQSVVTSDGVLGVMEAASVDALDRGFEQFWGTVTGQF